MPIYKCQDWVAETVKYRGRCKEMNKKTKSTRKGGQYHPRKRTEPRDPIVYEHSIPSREEIFCALAKAKTVKSIDALAKVLMVDSSATHALRNRLRAMTRDGQLRVDRSDKYTITKNSKVVEAKVRIQKNKIVTVEPLVDSKDTRIAIGRKQAGSLMLGDIILVRYFPDRAYGCLPIIVCVKQRAIKEIVGRIISDGIKKRLETIGIYTASAIIVKESETKKIKWGAEIGHNTQDKLNSDGETLTNNSSKS